MADYRGSHLGDGRGQLYDERYSEGRTGVLWDSVEKPFLRTLFQKLGQTHSGPFLDFAAGTGRIAELAAPFFPDLTGIDVSADMLKQARMKLPTATWLQVDVTRSTAAVPGPFQIIAAFRFFLNAEEPLRRDTLRWLRSVIRPDGILLCNNHLAATSPLGMIKSVLQAFGLSRQDNILANAHFTGLLRETGFSALRIFGCGFLPGSHRYSLLPPAWLGALEARLARRRGLHRLAENQLFLCRPIPTETLSACDV